jgi:hypothetical protein
MVIINYGKYREIQGTTYGTTTTRQQMNSHISNPITGYFAVATNGDEVQGYQIIVILV